MSLTAILLVVLGVMLIGNTVFGGLPGRLVTFAEAHGAAAAPTSSSQSTKPTLGSTAKVPKSAATLPAVPGAPPFAPGVTV